MQREGAQPGRQLYQFRRFTMRESIWEVPIHYGNFDYLGGGAFGMVCAAEDKRCGVKVAIKKLVKPFETDIHAKRVYRELRLLAHMRHENVIGLFNVYTSSNSQQFSQIYLVTDYLDSDLDKILNLQQLTVDHVKFLTYQILRGLKYIHSAGVIHRDLAPKNIAINANCNLKIIDFGLARPNEEDMTQYVVTRWYRAPEILMRLGYDELSDIWSAGCIMGEMMQGRRGARQNPVFPGNDQLDQLRLIIDLVGMPSDEQYSRMAPETVNYIKKYMEHTRTDFAGCFAGWPADCIDVLRRMLTLDETRRPSTAQLLQHKFFGQYHDPNDEPVAPVFDQQYESKDFHVDDWRRLIWEEVSKFEERLPPTDDGSS